MIPTADKLRAMQPDTVVGISAGELLTVVETLQKIHDEHGRNRWHPDTTFPTEFAKNWHDGYISALAHFAIMTQPIVDPEGFAKTEHLTQVAAQGSDEDWWRATGNCGRCAVVASACECEGECGCWEAHGPPLEPYKRPATLREENARLRAELEAYRQPLLFDGASA